MRALGQYEACRTKLLNNHEKSLFLERFHGGQDIARIFEFFTNNCFMIYFYVMVMKFKNDPSVISKE